MAKLPVEVVYALPGGHDCILVHVPPGTTLAGAVAASGMALRHPELEGIQLRLGVYGKEQSPESAAAAGDRIEIYRPLVTDPKEARRRRAARSRRRS